MNAAFLRGEGIALHFGGVTALHDVSFAVERGSLFPPICAAFERITCAQVSS